MLPFQAAFQECAEFFGENPKSMDANTFFGYFVRFVATWKAAELENERRRIMEMRAAAAAQAANNEDDKAAGNNRVVGRKNTVSYFAFTLWWV